MKKRELRIISKIGLLFVVIGFFMPMSCNLNGFQIAKTFETFGGPNILSISLYSIFIFSCIGLILLAALLMKKKFSIGYDWADLIIIITAFSVFMYGQLQSSDDPFLAIFSRLQSGAYIIFIGLVGALFYLIAATGKSKKGKNKDVHGTNQSEIPPDEVNNREIEIDEGGILYNKDKTTLIRYRPERVTSSFTIPDGVTTIDKLAFYDWTILTSITIPASVTSIGKWAFWGWTRAQTINVPFANANATPAGWDANWNQNCNAVIKYWNGATWE